MARKIVALCLMVVFAVSSSGCATIISGGSQQISIRSNPSDANIKIYDKKGDIIVSGKTPYIATLKKGDGYFIPNRYRIVISKSGYGEREIMVTSRMATWYLFGNFVFGGLIGYLIIDPASGAMWTLNPAEIDEDLSDRYSLLEQDEGLTIMLSKDVPDELREHMQPVVVD